MTGLIYFTLFPSSPTPDLALTIFPIRVLSFTLADFI